jgi:hypothetical protein
VQRGDRRARQLKLAARLQRHALPVHLHACAAVSKARRQRFERSVSCQEAPAPALPEPAMLTHSPTPHPPAAAPPTARQTPTYCQVTLLDGLPAKARLQLFKHALDLGVVHATVVCQVEAQLLMLRADAPAIHRLVCWCGVCRLWLWLWLVQEQEQQQSCRQRWR